MKKTITRVLLVLLTLSFLVYGSYITSNSRSFQFFGGIVQRVDTQEKVVALSFDDGPTPKTGEILELLEELDVKATFFVTGRELEQNFEEGESIVLAGHELGNHTYSHNRMVLKSPSFIRKEIERTDQLISQAGHHGDIHFRPPNGKKLVLLPYILKQSNKKTIMWDLEPDSFPEIASDSQKIVNYVGENVKPGSIILLHVMYEGRQESVNSLRGIVNTLRAEGYRFVTVSELLEYQGK